jgi:hypothetical protein
MNIQKRGTLFDSFPSVISHIQVQHNRAIIGLPTLTHFVNIKTRLHPIAQLRIPSQIRARRILRGIEKHHVGHNPVTHWLKSMFHGLVIHCCRQACKPLTAHLANCVCGTLFFHFLFELLNRVTISSLLEICQDQSIELLFLHLFQNEKLS